MADIFISTISSLSCRLQSKGHIKLDAGRKGQSLQDGCRLLVWRFFFQTHRLGHKKAKDPLSASVIINANVSPLQENVQEWVSEVGVTIAAPTSRPTLE
ncbi:hypothetical protein TNCV_2491821 [Trichonephila clavipes]|nr:hypothetical protein TNCV_2491821 [Trichonephila clavipes]